MPVTYNFNLNRDEVIKGALRLLGVIAQGQTPDTQQTTDASEALNVLVKAWQAEGLPLWAIKTVSFTPVSGDNAYTMGASLQVDTQEPLKVYQVWYRNTTDEFDVTLLPMVESQYNAIPNKENEGTPSSYFYKRDNGYGTLYLYQTPDSDFVADHTIYVSFQRPFFDFDSSTDTPDFPQEWLRALKYGLADEMSMEYGFPPAQRSELKKRADQYKQEALNFTQEEGSLFFQPEQWFRR